MSLSTIPFPAPPSADIPDVTTPTTPVQATFLKPKSSPKRSKPTTNEPKRSKRVRFVDQPTLIYIPSPSSAFSPLLTPLFESLNSMPDSDAEDDESPASLSLYHSRLTHARSPMHQNPTPSMPSMSMLIQRPLPPSPTRSTSPPPSPIPLPPPLPLPLPITPTASFQSDYDGDSDASIVFTPVSSKLAHLAPLMAPAPRRTRILSIGELSFTSSSPAASTTSTSPPSPHSNEVPSFPSVLSPRPKLKTFPKPASMLSPTRIPLPLSPRAGTPVPLSQSPAPFTFSSSTHPRLRIETLHLNSSSHTQHRSSQTRLRPRERKVSGTSPNAISRHKLHGYGQKAGSALGPSKRVRRTSGEGMNVVKRNGVGRQRGGIPSWERAPQEEEKSMGRIVEERERREVDEGMDLMPVVEEVHGVSEADNDSAADVDFVRGVQDATRDLNEATGSTTTIQRNIDPDVEPSLSTSTLPPNPTTDDDSIISLTNSLLSESQSHLSSLEESYESLLELKDLFIRDLRFEIDDLRSELHLSQFEESKGRTRIRELEDQLLDMEEKLEDREAKTLERESEVTRSEGQEMEMGKETEVMEMREMLEGAEGVAVMKTNGIIELESELQRSNQVVTKSQLEVRSLEVERDQLQVELGRLHDELEKTSRAQEKLKSDLDQRKTQGEQARRTLGLMEGGVRRIEGEIQALLALVERRGEEEECAIVVEEEDSVAESDEEGSVDTLVTAHETPSWATVTPPVENTDLKYFHQDQPEVPRPIQDIRELSYDERIRALEARLDGMRLRYEAAEASTVCGHDVDPLLRTQLGSLKEENGELRERIMEWEGRVGSEAEGESSAEGYGVPGSDFEGSEERWPDDVPLTMGVDSDMDPSFTQTMEREMLTASSLPSSPTDETSNGGATRVAPRPVSWVYDTLEDDGLASSDELSKRTAFGALKSARKTWLLDEELPEGGAHASDFEDLSSSILRLRSPHPSKGLRGCSGPRSKM